MIKIIDSSYKRLAIIKQVLDANRFEEINGENKLDFTAVYDEKAAEFIHENNLVEFDDDYFDIAYYQKQQNEDGTLTIQVESEHVSYRLNEPVYNLEYFAAYGSPTSILTQILAGTPFTVGTVEFSGNETYAVSEEISRRQLLVGFAEQLGGELLFSKFEVSIVQHRGSTEPKLLAKGKNVKVVSKVFNKRETDENGNPLVAYTCEPILVEPLALGDEVLLIQKDLGIQEPLRIVRYGYNPYDPDQASIELANFISGLEDQFYQIATMTVAKDKVYNGCKIGPEEGFVATRSDLKARAIMNATEGIKIQKGDGNGNWTDAIYLDTNGNGIFSGFILASQIIGGSILIGGDDFNDAKFSVTQTGKMTAEDAEIKKTLYLVGNEPFGAITQAIQFGVNQSPYLVPAVINFVQDTSIAMTNLNINSPGQMNLTADGALNLNYGVYVRGNSVDIERDCLVDRIRGLSSSAIIYFGNSRCQIDVSGGTMRIKNANGAYLAVTDNHLIYYNSIGKPHTIV